MGSKPNWGAALQTLGQQLQNYAMLKYQEQQKAADEARRDAQIQDERAYQNRVRGYDERQALAREKANRDFLLQHEQSVYERDHPLVPVGYDPSMPGGLIYDRRDRGFDLNHQTLADQDLQAQIEERRAQAKRDAAYAANGGGRGIPHPGTEVTFPDGHKEWMTLEQRIAAYDSGLLPRPEGYTGKPGKTGKPGMDMVHTNNALFGNTGELKNWLPQIDALHGRMAIGSAFGDSMRTDIPHVPGQPGYSPWLNDPQGAVDASFHDAMPDLYSATQLGVDYPVTWGAGGNYEPVDAEKPWVYNGDNYSTVGEALAAARKANGKVDVKDAARIHGVKTKDLPKAIEASQQGATAPADPLGQKFAPPRPAPKVDQKKLHDIIFGGGA